jgi:hypothetical protein
MSLAQKLHSIQSLARRVAKRGVNPEQGWEYLQIEDAVLAAKRAMKKHKLVLIGSLDPKEGGTFNFTRVANDRGSGYVVDIVMCWTLKDVESDEILTFYIPGSGWDYNDKGIFKAMTGSRKYAIIFIFNLAVGNDVEERGGSVEKAQGLSRQKEIAKEKLEAALDSPDAKIRAIAEEGLEQLTATPALFWTWFEESHSALVTGDKELMKRNADLLKEFKLGGKVIVSAAQLEVLKARMDERGILFKQLQAA